MSDTLIDRLRGQYEVGNSGAFGTRSFADFIPPISLEAADRIEALELALGRVKGFVEWVEILGRTDCEVYKSELKVCADDNILVISKALKK